MAVWPGTEQSSHGPEGAYLVWMSLWKNVSLFSVLSILRRRDACDQIKWERSPELSSALELLVKHWLMLDATSADVSLSSREEQKVFAHHVSFKAQQDTCSSMCYCVTVLWLTASGAPCFGLKKGRRYQQIHSFLSNRALLNFYRTVLANTPCPLWRPMNAPWSSKEPQI